MVTVNINTNCRTGPGIAYDIIGALTIGQSAEVVGKIHPATIGSSITRMAQRSAGFGDSQQQLPGTPLVFQSIPSLQHLLPSQISLLSLTASNFDKAHLPAIRWSTRMFTSWIVMAMQICQIGELINITNGVAASVTDGSITPSDKQKTGDVVTGTWNCGTKKYDVTLKATIYDQDGHFSNSIGFTFSCNQ